MTIKHNVKELLLEYGAVRFYYKLTFGGTCHLHLQGRRNNASEEKCCTVTNRHSLSWLALFLLP
jgi:hypothetical protein